ncbi:MAG: FimB/Mfa2 family fimbrial subunit [Tannerellaceae bacterium]
MKHSLIYLFMLVIVSASYMTSCTKENLKYCEPGVELTYFYELNKYYTNRFEKEVHKLSIYVFDRDQLFYQAFVVDNPAELGNDNVIHLPLPAGDWHLVSWGGMQNTYTIGYLDPLSTGIPNFSPGLIPGVTTLEAFRLVVDYDRELPTNPDEVGVTFDVDDLYYGANKKITTFTDKVVKETIPMMKNTQEIYLKMDVSFIRVNKQISRPAEGFDVYATVRNGRYTFENQIGEYARDLRYMQKAGIQGDTLIASLTVLRLMEEDEDGFLRIESSYLPDRKIEIPIVESILKHPEYNTQEDLDREDMYEFKIGFTADLDVVVNINGWEFIPVDPEL